MNEADYQQMSGPQSTGIDVPGGDSSISGNVHMIPPADVGEQRSSSPQKTHGRIINENE